MHSIRRLVCAAPSSACVSFVLASFVAACGGAAEKPPEGPASETSSLEPSSSPASESTAAPAASAPDTKPAAAPATSASSASGAAAAATPAAEFHPTPSATGTLDGKPFSPKLAQVSGGPQKDGRASIVLTEATDCVTGPKPGEGWLTLLVSYKDGYKTDLGSLKHTGAKAAREIGFARASASGKAQASSTFKPTGTITVVSAPTGSGATGKLKIDLQSGDYILAGDLDVKVCAPSK
jgi:hypothetical protein